MGLTLRWADDNLITGFEFNTIVEPYFSTAMYNLLYTIDLIGVSHTILYTLSKVTGM